MEELRLLWKNLKKYCKEENIEYIKITTGIPCGNRQTETMPNILIAILAKLSIDEAKKCYRYLSAVQRIMNNTVREAQNIHHLNF